MEQIQAQRAALDRDWCDTSLPTFAAEVERTFAFKGLAREFRVEFEVDSLVDLALAILVPQIQPVIRAWYADRDQPDLVSLMHPVDLQALDAWLVGEVRHWTARWHLLDPAQGGSAPTTRAAVDRLRQEIRVRSLPPALERAVAAAVAKR